MFKVPLILFLVCSTCSADKPPEKVRTVEERDRRRNESVVLDFIGLVEKHEGYTAEEYNVTSDDGYILGLHRITGSPSKPKADGKPVVYIQHGLFGSSDFMVVLGPNDSLAFEMADAGYDVWLGNVRGNTYSRAHTELDPDVNFTLFWDFRMDEMAVHDLPAFFDFVLETTGQGKLTYIGYSMGTTLIYMLLSSLPKYNDKVNLVVDLAPVVYFTKPVKPAFLFNMNTILATNYLFYELLPQSKTSYQLAKAFCSDGTKSVCTDRFESFTDVDRMNLTAVPEILAHAPAGSSYYTLKQYDQLVQANGIFRKYDYGNAWYTFRSNKYYYNQTTPPEYDLSLVTAPNALFYAGNDVYAKVEDVELLKSKLSNVVAFEKIHDEKFNHLDFIWNKDAPKLVNEPVMKVIAETVKPKL